MVYGLRSETGALSVARTYINLHAAGTRGPSEISQARPLHGPNAFYRVFAHLLVDNEGCRSVNKSRMWHLTHLSTQDVFTIGPCWCFQPRSADATPVEVTICCVFAMCPHFHDIMPSIAETNTVCMYVCVCVCNHHWECEWTHTIEFHDINNFFSPSSKPTCEL
jgi:hypothetical protein